MSTPDLPDVQWRTSSFSGHDGGECVEVAVLCANVAPHPGSAHPGSAHLGLAEHGLAEHA